MLDYFERGEFDGSTVGREWNIGERWRKIGEKFYITEPVFVVAGFHHCVAHSLQPIYAINMS